MTLSRARVRGSGLEQRPRHVPVPQLDKASDYESEDWGFKSLQGYVFFSAVGLHMEIFFLCPVAAVDGAFYDGALAQSVECVLCKHEVQGSKP